MKYTLLEKILVQGVGFLQGVLLARLLSPEDFGLAAMLGIFLNVAGTLAEGGLGSALVVAGGQSGGIARSVARAALRWNLGVACGLYLLLALASPALARFYGEAVLMPLLPVMALGMVVGSASAVAIARLTHAQAFGKIAGANACAMIGGSCVGIVCAWCGAGVWAVASVVVSASLIKTALAWGLSRGLANAEPDSEGAALRPVLCLGLKFMASSLIWNVFCNLNQLIIGKLYSPAQVGLFVRGQRWAQLPGDAVNEAVARVALPCLARGEACVKVGSISVAWWKVNVLLLWPGLVVLWIWAEEIVGFVLGPTWLACVPYLRILVFGAVLTPISNVALTAIKAKGAGDALLKTELFKKPVALAAVVAGAFCGIEGLAWAAVVGQLAEMIADVWVWKRLK